MSAPPDPGHPTPTAVGAAAPSPSAARRVGRRTVAPGSPRALAPDTEPAEAARQICLDQLAHRPRTRAELAATLARRGVPDGVAEQVLTRFTEVGLVDDDAFAQAWVARRSVDKGLARRALRQELRQRGVADATADVAVAALDPGLELQVARSLVIRRLATTRGLEPAARVRRLVAMLARKGFPPGGAYAVVRDVLGAELDEIAEPDDGGELDGRGDVAHGDPGSG